MPKALLGTAIFAHLCVGASFLLNAASYLTGHSVLPDFGDGDNCGLFLHAGMPGKRSVQAWFGWRRARDAYYSTSHSAPGLKFIEVPCHLAAQEKCIVRSKVLHHSRDAMVGATTRFARQASLGAARVGAISRETLKQDLRIHTAANTAKHTTLLSGRPAWADIAEHSDSDFEVLPTASGPSSAPVWPSTTTSSPTVSGTWLTARAPCLPTDEWDSPAALRGPTAATQTDTAETCDASTQTCDGEQIQQPPPYVEFQSYQHMTEDQHLPPYFDLQSYMAEGQCGRYLPTSVWAQDELACECGPAWEGSCEQVSRLTLAAQALQNQLDELAKDLSILAAQSLKTGSRVAETMRGCRDITNAHNALAGSLSSRFSSLAAELRTAILDSRYGSSTVFAAAIDGLLPRLPDVILRVVGPLCRDLAGRIDALETHGRLSGGFRPPPEAQDSPLSVLECLPLRTDWPVESPVGSGTSGCSDRESFWVAPSCDVFASILNSIESAESHREFREVMKRTDPSAAARTPPSCEDCYGEYFPDSGSDAALGGVCFDDSLPSRFEELRASSTTSPATTPTRAVERCRVRGLER